MDPPRESWVFRKIVGVLLQMMAPLFSKKVTFPVNNAFSVRISIKIMHQKSNQSIRYFHMMYALKGKLLFKEILNFQKYLQNFIDKSKLLINAKFSFLFRVPCLKKKKTEPLQDHFVLRLSIKAEVIKLKLILNGKAHCSLVL